MVLFLYKKWSKVVIRNDDAKRAKKKPSEVSDAASEGLFHYEFSKDRNNVLLPVFALLNPVYFFFVRI